MEEAGVGEPGERERGGRVVGVRVVDEQGVLADLGDLGHLDAAGGGVADEAAEPPVRRPKRIGSPWTSGMIEAARGSLSLIASKAPSLKIGQFW